VIRTAQTPGGLLDEEPRLDIPGTGVFPTKENNRVWTVRFNVGDLCFCLFASFRVVRIVLKICMRRVFDGVAVNNGSIISRSLR
jgi:hypothetical protein